MASEDRILSVNRMADSLIEAGHTGMHNHDAILEHHVITTCEQMADNIQMDDEPYCPTNSYPKCIADGGLYRPMFYPVQWVTVSLH